MHPAEDLDLIRGHSDVGQLQTKQALKMIFCVETEHELRNWFAVQRLYLADSFHSSSSPSRCRVSISVKSVGVGPSSSSLRI